MSILWYIVKLSQLTHIRSCTKARFPRDDAKCSGDLASLGLTDELTSSELQCAKTSATVLMSDLKYQKWRIFKRNTLNIPLYQRLGQFNKIVVH